MTNYMATRVSSIEEILSVSLENGQIKVRPLPPVDGILRNCLQACVDEDEFFINIELLSLIDESGASEDVGQLIDILCSICNIHQPFLRMMIDKLSKYKDLEDTNALYFSILVTTLTGRNPLLRYLLDEIPYANIDGLHMGYRLMNLAMFGDNYLDVAVELFEYLFVKDMWSPDVVDERWLRMVLLSTDMFSEFLELGITHLHAETIVQIVLDDYQNSDSRINVPFNQCLSHTINYVDLERAVEMFSVQPHMLQYLVHHYLRTMTHQEFFYLPDNVLVTILRYSGPRSRQLIIQSPEFEAKQLINRIIQSFPAMETTLILDEMLAQHKLDLNDPSVLLELDDELPDYLFWHLYHVKDVNQIAQLNCFNELDRDKNGYTLIQLAAEYRNWELAKLLIRMGCKFHGSQYNKLRNICEDAIEECLESTITLPFLQERGKAEIDDIMSLIEKKRSLEYHSKYFPNIIIAMEKVNEKYLIGFKDPKLTNLDNWEVKIKNYNGALDWPLKIELRNNMLHTSVKTNDKANLQTHIECFMVEYICLLVSYFPELARSPNHVTGKMVNSILHAMSGLPTSVKQTVWRFLY